MAVAMDISDDSSWLEASSDTMEFHTDCHPRPATLPRPSASMDSKTAAKWDLTLRCRRRSMAGVVGGSRDTAAQSMGTPG